MDKKQLAERLARQAHLSQGKAADHVDKFVYNILRDLKDDGKPAASPVQDDKAGASAPVPPPSVAKAPRRKS